MADLSILQMTRKSPAGTLILPAVDPSAPSGLKNVAVTIADLLAAASASPVATATVAGLASFGTGFQISGQGAVTLAPTGATAGTYTKVTVAADGRVTVGDHIAGDDLAAAINTSLTLDANQQIGVDFAGADFSAAGVVVGGRPKRALSAWLADMPSLAAFGADVTGSADSGAAILAAAQFTQSRGTGAVFAAPGTYKAASIGAISGTVPGFVGVGAEISADLSQFGQSPGSFLGDTDAALFSLLRPMASGKTQATAVFEGTMLPSNSAASYEKMGLYVTVQTRDPSDYSGAASTWITRDAVAGQFAATAAVSNSRAFAASSIVTAPAGVTGVNGVGFEVDVKNDAYDASGLMNKIGAMTALSLVSLGAYPASAAAFVTATSASNQFRFGFAVNANAVTSGGHAFWYGDPQGSSPFFSVDASGNVSSAGDVSAGNINANSGVYTAQGKPVVVQGAAASLLFYGAPTGGSAAIELNGSGNVDITYSALGTGVHHFNSGIVVNSGDVTAANIVANSGVYTAQGKPVVIQGAAASLLLYGAATGGYASLELSGTGDVDITYSALGAGKHHFNSDIVVNAGHSLQFGVAATAAAGVVASKTIAAVDSVGNPINLLVQ